MSPWTCLGIPPRVPPCDATGTTDKGAEKHTRETQHTTVSDVTASTRRKP